MRTGVTSTTYSNNPSALCHCHVSVYRLVQRKKHNKGRVSKFQTHQTETRVSHMEWSAKCTTSDNHEVVLSSSFLCDVLSSRFCPFRRCTQIEDETDRSQPSAVRSVNRNNRNIANRAEVGVMKVIPSGIFEKACDFPKRQCCFRIQLLQTEFAVDLFCNLSMFFSIKRR